MGGRRGASLAALFVAAIALAGCTPAGSAAESTAPHPGSAGHVNPGVATVKQTLTKEQQTALAPIRKSSVRHAENKDLDGVQVESRLRTIDSHYRPGEAFSDADAEFVRAYATPNADAFDPSALTVKTASSATYNRSGGSGTKVCAYSATISHSSGMLTGQWSTTLKMTSGSAITKVTIAAHPRSYGVIGKSGIGITYAADPSVATTVHSYSFNRSANYTSVLEVYFTMYDDLTCYYTGGTFVVK